MLPTAPFKRSSNERGIIERVWITVTEPQAAGIFGGLLFLFLFSALIVSLASGVAFIIGVALLAGVLTTALYVVSVGVSTFDKHETRMIRARAVAWAKSALTEEEQESRFSSIYAFDAGAELINADQDIHQPLVNVDGSPMMGSVDINGNLFGVTSDHTFDAGAELINADQDIHQPLVNVDGSPMMGSVDINGNLFGVTSGHDFGGGFSNYDFGDSSSDINKI